MAKKFWSFRNQTKQTVELLLYGDIASEQSWFGDNVTPNCFAEELSNLGAVDAITVCINSGGGDVFAAQAIGNLLEQHSATVTARIDGLCASAATVVACHCDSVIAANDSTYMIHPVQMGICGYCDAVELQTYLEALATIRDNILSLYEKKTGREKADLATWMDNTSWWTGKEAKEHGFVDELTDSTSTTNYENRGGVLFVNQVNTSLSIVDAPMFLKNITTGEKNIMELKTIDELRENYPTLVAKLEQEAEQRGVNRERTRIHDIEDMALSGSESLAVEAKYTSPMSAEDFAKAMIRNAKTQGATYLAAVKQETEQSGVNQITSPPATNQRRDEFLNAIQNIRKNV